MKKYELAELVQKNKSLDKSYKVDEIFKTHGHNVLRLPPYMCELNPIELAWAKIKRIIRENNNSTLSGIKLLNLTTKAVDEITEEDWRGFCNHVQKIEKKYIQRDEETENIMEQISEEADAMNATSCSSDSDSDSDSSSNSSLQDE
uniref:protein FAM243A-like n=1 Tax=Osmia lignaria TaxID=473952 RepID=UPI001479038A|nr:protein FAM243A-like [Osmia lignaria]